MLALILLAFNATAAINLENVYQQRMEIVRMGQDEDKIGREAGVVEALVGGQVETSMDVMESRRLWSGQVRSQPWSGHYWGNSTGGLGMRWADPNFPRKDWGRAENYVLRNRWNQVWFEILSPAEKYDYLTGVNPTEEGSLTRHQWNLGRDEYLRTGTVAEWQGICHGWSPASIYLPAPQRSVAFKFPQGDLVLNIDDIKALGSLYWANGTYETLYAGFRCNERAPRTNSRGRVEDPNCFDVNPADWHLAVVNLTGARRESFLIDAAETSEVWNHPVVGYRMEFFDPYNTNRRAASFRQVMREAVPNEFRSPNAAYVVGVISNTVIATEVTPGNHQDKNVRVVYVYELELDRDMKVIGGEWRAKARPDFLWRPRPGTKPTLPADSIALDYWRMGDDTWRRASLQNSEKGAPLRAFVEHLFKLAQ